MSADNIPQREKLDEWQDDQFDLITFRSKYRGFNKWVLKKNEQQDWILDLAVPASIFAIIAVIVAILVLLKNN